MKKILQLFGLILLSSVGLSAQVYLDQFDNDAADNVGGAASYTHSEANGEWTIDVANNGQYEPFNYQPHDQSNASLINVDASGNNKVYVRAKSSNIGTELRMDLVDNNDYHSTLGSLTKVLTTDYMILEYDFTGFLADQAYGGTGCTAGPCALDATMIAQMAFYVNSNAGGGYTGSVVIDYISFGEEPSTVIMSDIFQDHFDQDSSINAIGAEASSYVFNLDNSILTVEGDGTNGPWNPFNYKFRNPNTLEDIDVDISGNDKIYVKMRSSVDGLPIRMDAEDIDGFVTTLSPVTKTVGTEWEVFEFNYSGAYLDAGWGGTSCVEPNPPADPPCVVDPTRIENLIIFIFPGEGGFVGNLEIEYISVGTSLDPPGAEPVYIYGDHFDNNVVDFVSDSPGFFSTESGTEWLISGDGSAAPYASMGYTFHDEMGGIALDMTPAQDKIFVRAKTNGGTVALRIDLQDVEGFVTNLNSVTREITDEWQVIEYNFEGAYFDAYGAECATGPDVPCPVDPTQIANMLLYPDAPDGGYSGEIVIDFIGVGGEVPESVGPLGIVNYSDQMDDNTSIFVNNPGGYSSEFVDDVWTITGDGTVGPWTAIGYVPHNDLGESLLVNVAGSNNTIYVRAKASVDQTNLRMDLIDINGFATNSPDVNMNLTTEYVIYEYVWSTYQDGAFGGNCADLGTDPCPVDGERIVDLALFINAADGGYDGTVEIDWISFGMPIGDVVPSGFVNYQDNMDDSTADFITTPDGYNTTVSGEIMTIVGDGTGAPFGAISYLSHDDAGEPILMDGVLSNNLFYISARSTVDQTEMRIDFNDNLGFNTNANPGVIMLGTEFETQVIDYTNRYSDGGFTEPCQSQGAPCPVDGQRLEAMQLFLLPGVGAFEGTVDIEWVSWGVDLTVSVEDIAELDRLGLFPNPSTGRFVADFDLNESTEVGYIVYNSVGQLIARGNPQQYANGQNQFEINLDDQTTGQYFVQLIVNGQSSKAFKLSKI